MLCSLPFPSALADAQLSTGFLLNPLVPGVARLVRPFRGAVRAAHAVVALLVVVLGHVSIGLALVYWCARARHCSRSRPLSVSFISPFSLVVLSSLSLPSAVMCLDANVGRMHRYPSKLAPWTFAALVAMLSFSGFAILLFSWPRRRAAVAAAQAPAASAAAAAAPKKDKVK